MSVPLLFSYTTKWVALVVRALRTRDINVLFLFFLPLPALYLKSIPGL